MTALLDELVDWLQIPSVSTGDADADALERAAQWVVDRVRAAGGEAEQVVLDGGNPLAVGELRAAAADAPTVLIYGHYDVQGPGPDHAWTSPAFTPEVRDGRLYARGAADDKGNFLPLLHVACAMAREGTLPVHVRVLVEGEEEVAGAAAATWVRIDERGADAAIVFDSGMPDPDTPAVTVGLRGMVDVDVTVRTAPRNLHSGLYGGTVLNALHVLHAQLAHVVPGADGRVRDELRAGTAPVADAERESWATLVPGEQAIAESGGHPVAPTAGAEFYERTGAAPSLEVNQIAGGEPRTIVPPEAYAKVTMRLAPGQDPNAMSTVLLGLLRQGLPDGAELDARVQTARPSLFEVDNPVIQLAARALEAACGRAPVFVRSGGSIPIVAEMAARGYPVIVGGFGLPDDAIHAPDESYALRSLEWGEAAARELYLALAELPR